MDESVSSPSCGITTLNPQATIEEFRLKSFRWSEWSNQNPDLNQTEHFEQNVFFLKKFGVFYVIVVHPAGRD